MESMGPQLAHGGSDGQSMGSLGAPGLGHTSQIGVLANLLFASLALRQSFSVALMVGCHRLWEQFVLGEGCHICPGRKHCVSGGGDFFAM
jgi:hypothetical protein